MQKQPTELDIVEAARAAVPAAEELLRLADEFPQHEPGEPLTRKHWQADAGTFVCHTHITIQDISAERFSKVKDLFYQQAALPRQPWYPEFLGGSVISCDLPPEDGVLHQQQAVGRFDLNVGKPRCYRQLVSLHGPREHTRVIAARSIDSGPPLPGDTVLAYTLDPNGEVLSWQDGVLHWHHICTTPGAMVLPGPLDRWLINALRATGLDRAERATYAREAINLANWLRSDGFDADYAALCAAAGTVPDLPATVA